MQNLHQFYINGEWVEPIGEATLDVINPATEQPFASIRMGNAADVDKAVAAAKSAFESFSQTTREERIALLERIITVYKSKKEQLATAMTAEMGAPTSFSSTAQVGAGVSHIYEALKVLKNYEFNESLGETEIVKEPIGVCGLITPWNWPLNQITCKVAPAIAAGCTMVLKPSEVAPVSAYLFAEILHEAGVPAGVFNLVNGDGAVVGSTLTQHPDVDMVSFTGSTRAGQLVSKAAADTVKRVALELGGKSANIILEDADLELAVKRSVRAMMMNSGQSCNAHTRMLVPKARLQEAEAIASKTAASIKVGSPENAETAMGPVVSAAQWSRIQHLIQQGIDEGAKVVCGGTGRPDGLETGYYVKPTVFSDVNNDMTIAREEVFGPVLCILGYDDEAQAVRIANDTIYGLSAGVWSSDIDKARHVAKQLRAGNVHINGALVSASAPFGGYKQSGIGREWGRHGFEEYLETKAILGYRQPE